MTELEFELRDARAEDLDVLTAFVVDEAREAEGRELAVEASRAAVAAALADPALARYWIVERGGGEPVGAIASGREWSDWSNAAYWWIRFVYLRPEARGRGLLVRMVDHVRACARADGAPELRLHVHPANERAVRAYEKLGFAALPYRVMGLRP